MTDQLEPTGNTSRPEDAATSRVPVSPVPTAPLTPAGRASSTSPTYEHEVAWTSSAPATPIVPTAKARRRAGRVRWAISIAVIALVIGTTAAIAAIVTGASSAATVLGYVPEGTIMYGEVRLDLPGDQRQAVGAFLAKFPGFKDQAALDTKLDEVLDDLVKDASKGEQSYTGNIKPWFDGELAFSAGPLPPAASVKGGQPPVGSLRALALLSVKDPVAAQAWFTAAIAKNGATNTTTETYNGTTLTIFAEMGGDKAAFALIDGKVAVAGDVASVKAAVDTKGSSGFASEAGPKAALDASTGEHVGFVYVAIGSLFDWSTEVSKASPESGVAQAAITGVARNLVPDWGGYWLRLEGDAVVMEAVTPKAAAAIGPTTNRTSTVAEHVPGTAIFAAISNDLGQTLTGLLDLERSDPDLKSLFDGLDQGLALVGGPDAALGWAGDTAVVVNIADGTPEGGLIVTPTDKAAAGKLFTALRALVAIGGGQQGPSFSDEDYNGTTITTIDVGDLGALSGMAGAPSAIPVPAGKLGIAYAVTDDIVVIGSGAGFVKHVLDTTKATSLASNERYSDLVDRAGAGTGTVFVDIAAVRGLIEKAAVDGKADAASIAKYEQDVKPFITPFDAMVASSSVDGDLNRSVIYITVK